MPNFDRANSLVAGVRLVKGHYRYLDPKANKRKSQISEVAAARNFSGRTQIASGALRHAKGDVKTDTYLIEDKVTDRASFSLKKALWHKIRTEAFNRQRVPMLRITVDGLTLCVVAESHLLELNSK